MIISVFFFFFNIICDKQTSYLGVTQDKDCNKNLGSGRIEFVDLSFVRLKFVEQYDSTCVANGYYIVVFGIFRLMGSG